MKTSLLFTVLCSLISLCAWGANGDKFSITTAEGVVVQFTVTDESEKTCRIGGGDDVSIDPATTGKITIPEVANGYTVTQIQGYAFYQCSQLTEVVLPNTITSIGIYAFDNCSSMAKVNLPTALISIGNNAFDNCDALTSITIPAKVKTIGKYAFGGKNLKVVRSLINIPPRIDGDAFWYTPDDAVLYVPKGRVALYKATAGWNHFSFIEEEATVPEGETFSINVDNRYNLKFQVVSNEAHTCVVAPQAIDPAKAIEVEIPSFVKGYFVTGIGNQAFKDCAQLVKVILPSSIQYIGEEAFEGCNHLVIFDCNAEMTSIQAGAFRNCANLRYIGLSASLTTIGAQAFKGCKSLEFVELPAQCTVEPNSEVFAECTGLKYIVSHVVSPGSGVPVLTPTSLNIGEYVSLYVPEGTIDAWYTAWQNYNSGEYAHYARYLIEGDGPSFQLNTSDFNDQRVYNYIAALPIATDGIITFPEMMATTSLNLSGISGITSIRGAEQFRNLRTLDVSNCEITSILRLSNFRLLTTLNARWNHLQTMDLTNNLAIENVYLSGQKTMELPGQSLGYANTGIRNLDLSHNFCLRELSCNSSGVRKLDVSNCLNLRSLVMNSNEVTDYNPSVNPWLETANLAGNPFGTIDLSKNEYITSLEVGSCKLKELDVSPCVLLKYLECSGNQLSTLDVSNNWYLTELNCSNNQIWKVVPSRGPNFTTMHCERNQLRSLDLTNCPQLRVLFCNDNLLKNIDLSKVPQLVQLYCNINQLRTLDLSPVPNMRYLQCAQNQLMTLDLRVAPNISQLNVTGQKLLGEIIVVDGRSKVGIHVPNDFDINQFSEFYRDSVAIGNYNVVEENGEKAIVLDIPYEDDIDLLNTVFNYQYNPQAQLSSFENKRMDVTLDVSTYALNLRNDYQADGYYMNTLYLDYPTALPDDVEAYFMKQLNANEGKGTMVIKERVLPAETAAVIRGRNAGLVVFNPINTQGTTGVLNTRLMDNLLLGSSVDKVCDGTAYLFSMGSDGHTPGFWRQTITTLPAHRAYLTNTTTPQPTTSNGYAISFVSDATLGIDTLGNNSNTAHEQNAWYSLAGQRLLQKPTQPGIYLHKGKKVIVK